MPFNSIDQITNADAYTKVLKKELGDLTATPSEFFFFDGYPAKDSAVILLGAVKGTLVQELKKTAGNPATGQCINHGGSVQLRVEKGKMPAAKLKPVFLQAKVRFAVVDELDAGGEKRTTPEALAAKAELELLTKHFNDVKGRLTDEGRIKIRETFARAVELHKLDQQEAALKAMKATREAIRQALDMLASDVGDTISAKADKAEKAKKQLEAQVEGIKEERKQIMATVKQLNTDLVAASKPKKGKPVDSTLVNAIKGRITELQQRFKDQLAVLRKAEGELPAQKTKVDEALQKELAGLARDFNALSNATLELGKKADKVGKISESEELTQAGEQISPTIEKMDEAREWQEGQLEEARTSNKHGTGRHGAQTGLERQARRAATGGTTPDQAGNEAGTAQVIQKWRGTEIEYETLPNGKVQIKNKKDVLKSVLVEHSSSVNSPIGSMFATPVLEMEAVKTAEAVSDKFKDFTHYQRDGAWLPLTNITLTLGPPAKGPGWGYAVQRNTTPKSTLTKANTELARFEKGEITLQQLFTALDVSLVERPSGGGVQMIPNAKVVMRRGGNTGKFAEVTHYPDSRGTKGWQVGPDRSWAPSTVKFKDAKGKQSTVSATAL